MSVPGHNAKFVYLDVMVNIKLARCCFFYCECLCFFGDNINNCAFAQTYFDKQSPNYCLF
jgi:hypothetical protein